MKAAVDLIKELDMLGGVSKLLCAVSGGADSMCLLHFMRSYLKDSGTVVAAAHFNHRLRGAESDRDERFVADWCRENGVELITGSGEVAEYAAKMKLSKEEAARDMRYAFLDDSAKNCGAQRVATAHNADDMLETMLMNLARGSGGRGIAGIPPVRGIYIRPLLGVSRGEILEYLDANRVAHVEDSSNAELDVRRNMVRHCVVPALKEVYPSAAKSAYRCARLLRRDDEYLSGEAERYLRSCVREGGKIVFELETLLALPYPLASRALVEAARELGQTLSSVHISQVLELAGSTSPSARLSLPGGINAAREYGRLIIHLKTDVPSTFTEKTLVDKEWISVEEAGYRFLLRFDGDKSKINGVFNIFFFKKTAVCGKISVRPRKTGDAIKISPNGGTKSLKKLFIEKKIPLSCRELVCVIADEAGVLCVPGIGIDARAAVSGGEEAFLIAVEEI